MNNILATYLPQDRRKAIAKDEALPGYSYGASLFADISGFTALTEALTHNLGSRRGAEELSQHLNNVYDALITQVDLYNGSVIGFAGDAMTIWFDESENHSSWRAVSCAFALQQAMEQFSNVLIPNGKQTTSLSLKIAIASGPTQRFVVGNSMIQILDALVGSTVIRMAIGEHIAYKGEIVVDDITVARLGEKIQGNEWRVAETKEKFLVLKKAIILDTCQITPKDEDFLDPEKLRPWLLSTVYNRHQAGIGEFLTELRPVTILFARFGGIDYDHELVGSQLNSFICQVQAILENYEGALLQLIIGDKGSYLYASFGAPVAHEDDTRRAIQVALELHQIPHELPWLHLLQIGISRGTLRAGAYGSRTRRTYGVLGDEVNLAARLMQTALPGETLVSIQVQVFLGQDIYTFEPRPPLLLKGKTEPLPVFVVTGHRQRRAIRLQEPMYSLPMIGRHAELQFIKEKMELVLQGKGQIIGISAEAGMGKSRLLAEAIRMAHRRGFICYGGMCQSDSTNTPYLVWQPIWQAIFDIDPMASLRKQTHLLVSELEDHVPQRVQAFPLLGMALGLPIPDNEFTHSLEPRYRKSVLEAMLVDYLNAIAHKAQIKGGGIFLVLEDLHWIDALSHDLLIDLAHGITNLPVIIILAYRPPEIQRLQAPRAENFAHFSKLTLTGLNSNDLEGLIRVKLAQMFPSRGGAIPPVLVERLTTQAQGNPFFVEEMLNYLHDRGLDPRDPISINQIEIPDSLHTLILSRIDQLSEQKKITLKVASVIGRLFQVSWLRGYYPALGNLEKVKTSLDELHQLDITLLDTLEPELTYLFKHIITHEVTYESLSYEMRTQLHEQLAIYLETLRSGNPQSLLSFLAFHYGRSKNIAKQQEYFLKAGEWAQATYANEAALEYYARSMSLPLKIKDQIGIRLKQGTVLELVGRSNEAEIHYQEAIALAEQVDDKAANAQCQWALGHLNRLRGDFDKAINWLKQAQDIWDLLDDRAGKSRTAAEIGIIFVHRGDYPQARYHLEQSLSLAHELNDLRGKAIALNTLGVVAVMLKDYMAATSLYGESLILRREIGDKPGISASLTNQGNLAFRRGDYKVAMALHEESLTMHREMGDKQGIIATLNNLAITTFTQGDYSASQKLFEDSLTLAREIGNKIHIAASLNNLGLMAYLQNDYGLAQRFYQECLSIYIEIGLARGVIKNLAGLIGVVARLGYFQWATRLAAAVETARLAINMEWDTVVEQQPYEDALRLAKEELSEAVFKTAWMEGEQMTIEETVDYLQTCLASVKPDHKKVVLRQK